MNVTKDFCSRQKILDIERVQILGDNTPSKIMRTGLCVVSVSASVCQSSKQNNSVQSGRCSIPFNLPFIHCMKFGSDVIKNIMTETQCLCIIYVKIVC